MAKRITEKQKKEIKIDFFSGKTLDELSKKWDLKTSGSRVAKAINLLSKKSSKDIKDDLKIAIACFAVAENINFNTTIYYQPGVTDFSDYKASFLMAFNFLVNKKFSISLQYDIAYD